MLAGWLIADALFNFFRDLDFDFGELDFEFLLAEPFDFLADFFLNFGDPLPLGNSEIYTEAALKVF